MNDKYINLVQTSVTNFIYCGEEYLFLHRNKDKRIDPDRLNGIGGRLDPAENYLEAVIRETEEETGYKVSVNDIQFCGIVKLEGGYDENWVMGFFKTKVSSKMIPIGNDTKDGKLIWLHKDNVLKSEYELVDDLNYCFEDVAKGEKIFFTTLQLNEKQKVIKASKGYL